MSVVSEATSTAPPPAGPLSGIGAAYSRNGRPSRSMSSNPVAPDTRAARASRSSGSTPAPSVSDRARIRPRASITSTAIDAPRRRALERARGVQHRRGRDGQLGHVLCPLSQGAVERAPQRVADEQDGRDAEKHERDQDRSGRREDEPEPQRLGPPEAHPSSRTIFRVIRKFYGYRPII